ncbi:MAG: ISAs1 family transposase [Thermoguttaceae bacterium]|nr:ISAs1 family transposase [Thermoguttaceae bacterium]
MAAKRVKVESLGRYFESLPDPRQQRSRRHLLVDIIVISVSAIVCGCDGPTAIHRWAKHHQHWLQGLLSLPNGIPSRDCIRRVLIALKPEAFQQCFQQWIAAAITTDDEGGKRLISIDGKTCRGSHDASKGLGALHIVSAWASEEGIALGQVATEEKSNEITAIPQLLKQIDLNNAVITIDAMGCQKEIARQIVKGHGDFVIAVKDNQPKLRASLDAYLEEYLKRDLEDLNYREYDTLDDSHGRIEERSYFLRKIPADFPLKQEWPWVKAVGYALRVTQNADGTESSDMRLYILSKFLSAKRFSEAVRGHWSIESMHWVLDVNFREDESRTRERTMGNNLSWLRRFAISILKRHPSKDSLRGKMMSCMTSTEFLTEVLTLQGV